MSICGLHDVLNAVLALLQGTQALKVEASSTIHLALDELEPVYLAFDMPLFHGNRSASRTADVSFEAGDEPC